MIVRANKVVESASVSSDVISSNKLAGYQSDEKHRRWGSNNFFQINDPLTSSAREVGDHLHSEHQVVAGAGASAGHLHTNIESPWNSQYFYQQTLPWEGTMPGQQFAEVEEPSQFQDSTKGKRQVNINLLFILFA